MRIYFLLTVAIAIEIPNIQALKCRTREHMKQQQDFYNLASNCMKSSMNITQSDNRGSWDYRQHRQQQPQQQPAQHHGNRQHYDNHYDTNGHHGNRYDRNKMNFGYNEEKLRRKSEDDVRGSLRFPKQNQPQVVFYK